VLWIELFPAQLEVWEMSDRPGLRRTARRISPFLNKVLIWIIALGLLLPTMHQSSLGSVMLMAGQKLNALWQTPFLPVLFLVSCISMGYAVVVFEATICTTELRRPRETKMLSSLSFAMVVVLGLWLGLRFFDLSLRDQFGAMFSSGWLSIAFWLETFFAVPAVFLLNRNVHRNDGKLLLMAFFMLLGGALYRFNTYLIAFNPGAGWSYFPAVPELMVTVGLVSFEVMAYIVIIRRFPILRGERPKPNRVSAQETSTEKRKPELATSGSQS
jgi:Ni/Fe-hydrogenase subunit HybB-like protein